MRDPQDAQGGDGDTPQTPDASPAAPERPTAAPDVHGAPGAPPPAGAAAPGGLPSGYGALQGYGPPPGYGAPQGYGPPPGYGAPQGRGPANAYAPPGAHPSAPGQGPPPWATGHLAPDGSALPYNPYGPPPPTGAGPADPANPYGPPPGAGGGAGPYGPPPGAGGGGAPYGGAPYPGSYYAYGLPPKPPFPGVMGFLLLVVIGFALNAGIGGVGMIIAALANGADLRSLSAGGVFKAIPLTVLLAILLLASLSWPAVALVAAKLTREWSRATFRLRWPGILPNVMAVLMGLALVPVALALEHGASRLVPRGSNELMQMMLQQPGALGLTLLGVTLVIAAPVGEELLFRGLSLRGLERRYGALTAAFLVSMIFSAVHLNLTGFSALFLVSLVLCWITSRTGSLVPAILLHAAYNGLQFLALALGDHSEAAVKKALESQSLGVPLWVVFAGAGVVVLCGFVVARFTPKPAPEQAEPA